MTIIGSNVLAGSSGQAAGGYAIERSLRFNSADSAYLSRTFGSPTDQDVFTLSLWVKRSALGSTQQLFGVSTNHSFGFTSGDALNLTFGGSSALTTTALFRDPSAWYHIMWVQNGTSHTLYVNGTSVGTATATSDTFNTAVAHQIGAGNTTNFFNGYLAYVHFIDGQAKSPSTFGADDDNGIWQPLVYTGGYGANGFELKMDDNSTAAALGTDTSPNGNNWTPNNLSVTAGAGNDSLVDVPTNGAETDTGAGGEVRGNYCTLNPLKYGGDIQAPTNGNLDFTSVGSANGKILGTIGVSSGKWYWECVPNSSDNIAFGITKDNTVLANYPGQDAVDYSYHNDGLKYSNNSGSAYGASFTTNDVIGVAFDADNGTLTFYKNNSSQGQAYSGLTTGPYFPMAGDPSSIPDASATVNFGQRPFAYTAPSGFKALNTANLPAGTITTSGSFTGNANSDGPFTWLNGVPTSMTINGNAVTFGTHADKLANGFKVRSSSGSYNTAGSNTYSITATGDNFNVARAQPNP